MSLAHGRGQLILVHSWEHEHLRANMSLPSHPRQTIAGLGATYPLQLPKLIFLPVPLLQLRNNKKNQPGMWISLSSCRLQGRFVNQIFKSVQGGEKKNEVERQRKETHHDLNGAFKSSCIRGPNAPFHVSHKKLSNSLNASAMGEGSKAFTVIS